MNKIVPFFKMHGCGNDFVLIDTRHHPLSNQKTAAEQLLQRRFGVGGDQLVLLSAPSADIDAGIRMDILNPDGSQVEMCGNALRCVGLFMQVQKQWQEGVLRVDTPSGICEISEKDGLFRVQMGAPDFSPAACGIQESEALINSPRQFGDLHYNITAVSMGNPHAITFCEEIDSLRLEEIGPQVENSPLFGNRINTEFIRLRNRHEVDMRVWERGAGETLACGSGACAAAVAAITNGHCDSPVLVHLRGGDLRIEWQGEGQPVIMHGPATLVFEGQWQESQA